MAGIAYHPWFAAHGTKDFSDGKKWYETSIKVTSLYDCVVNAGTGNGRPDSKTAEHCYINGQGGLICYAIPNAKTPTYKHQEEVRRNLVDGYIENGVEIISDVVKYGLSNTNYWWFSSINNYFDILKDFPIGKMFYLKTDIGVYLVTVSISRAGEMYATKGTLISGVYPTTPSSNYSFFNEVKKYYIERKSPYLATQGTTTHTDLIGIS